MTRANENIRYEPDDRSPHLISAGLGFQITAIALAPVAVTVAIIARAADQPENYIAWAVFAAVAVSGKDRLAYLDEQSETPDEREISFRLLRHYASSVNHRKYHDIGVVSVQVQGSR